VLNENEPMLTMCRELGFEIKHQSDNPGMALVKLEL